MMTLDDPRLASESLSWCSIHAVRLLNTWRKEKTPDIDSALLEAADACRCCVGISSSAHDPGALKAKLRAQVMSARLNFIIGDSASVYGALAQLGTVVQQHPYGDNVEEAILFIALGQSALPSEEQTAERRFGAIRFLEYLTEGYTLTTHEGYTEGPNESWKSDLTTTRECLHLASSSVADGDTQPREFAKDAAKDRDVSRDRRGTEETPRGRLSVEGIPLWALYFLIGLFSLREGDSRRALGAMENAFLFYEVWLPRPSAALKKEKKDADGLRRAWFRGVSTLDAWVRHPRPWLDLGDVLSRKGAGCFHVAAEVYQGALQRAHGVLPAECVAEISYQIAKCQSRSGNIAGATVRMECLLYGYNFWDNRYRSHLEAWSEPWREYFVFENKAALDLQCAWRVARARKEHEFLLKQDQLAVEYRQWKRRIILKRCFRTMVEYCASSRRIQQLAAILQGVYRVYEARQATISRRMQRELHEALIEANLRRAVEKLKLLCWDHWILHHRIVRQGNATVRIQAVVRGVAGRKQARDAAARRSALVALEKTAEDMGRRKVAVRFWRRLRRHAVSMRRERAVIRIQAVVRGVEGRGIAADETRRLSRIDELVLRALGRVAGPVMREWYAAAQDLRRVRVATRIQARWRTHKAERDWQLVRSKIDRARRMGQEAMRRTRIAHERCAFDSWKRLILERKARAIQGSVRVWMAKKGAARLGIQRRQAHELLLRVMRPARQACFSSLARHRTDRLVEKARSAVVLQCWTRCQIASGRTKDAWEYGLLLQRAYESVASGHDRRILQEYCFAWKWHVSTAKGTGRIQALWRGRRGRSRAVRIRARRTRFERLVEKLWTIHEALVRKRAFMEWTVFTRTSQAITRVKAYALGYLARKRYAARALLRRRQQAALCRAMSARTNRLMSQAMGCCRDHADRCRALSRIQANVRRQITRRRVSVLRSCARETSRLSLVGGTVRFKRFADTCRLAQACWRRALGQRWRQRAVGRARLAGEIRARVFGVRKIRVLKEVWSAWREVRERERAAVLLLQSVARGIQARRRASLLRGERRRINGFLEGFRQLARRRLMLRCFRAIEAYQVDSYIAAIRAFMSGEHGGPGDADSVPFDTEHRPFCGSLQRERALGEEGRGAIDGKRSSRLPSIRYERSDSRVVWQPISKGLDKTTPEVGPTQPSSKKTMRLGVETKRRRHKRKVDPLGPAMKSRAEGREPGLPRLPGAGCKIVWEEDSEDPLRREPPEVCLSAARTGATRGNRDIASDGERSDVREEMFWTRPWEFGRESRQDFASSEFFAALRKVRDTGVLDWRFRCFSPAELLALLRLARVVVLDPAPTAEVRSLVEALRYLRSSSCRSVPVLSPAWKEGECPAGRDTPAVILCNGDRDGLSKLSRTAHAAIAALAGSEQGSTGGPLCSSLSVIAFPLGNAGALAIAKALCRRGSVRGTCPEEASSEDDRGGDGIADNGDQSESQATGLRDLCLESCGIGNAGAAALGLALREWGLTKQNQATWEVPGKPVRKLVLSRNPIGGVPASARALRGIMTIRGGGLEVLDLSHCTVTDDDVCLLSEGLADPRCRLVALRLSNNSHLRDRGAKALADALRARRKLTATVHDPTSLQIALRGCSINTWGCRSLAACVVDTVTDRKCINSDINTKAIAEARVPLTLDLARNRIKEVGIEAMSCAAFGLEYDDHLAQRHRAWRAVATIDTIAHDPRCGDETSPEPSIRPESPAKQGESGIVGAGDFPPLRGTPFSTAATSRVPSSTRMTVKVNLEGNPASMHVVQQQRAIAGSGEPTLLHGCVLPEAIALSAASRPGAFRRRDMGAARQTRSGVGPK